MRALLLSLLVLWTLSGAIAYAQQATVTYGYDDLGRLEQIDYGANKTVDYTYDPAGNRTTRVVSGTGTGSSADGVSVIVLPISGFTVLPVRNPNCGAVAGCS